MTAEPKRVSLPSMLSGCSIPAATSAGAGWLSATYMPAVQTLRSMKAAATRARTSFFARTLRPKAKKAAQPRTLIETAVIRFVRGEGFSNGWAELALKIPPPLMPSCLIASWLAAGNREIVCDPPSRPVAVADAARLWTTPRPASTMASTIASGSST